MTAGSRFGQRCGGHSGDTPGVDAARSLMLDQDVMTVIEVSWFGGTLDGVVPGVLVLVGIDILLGAIAVYLLSRASSADVA